MGLGRPRWPKLDTRQDAGGRGRASRSRSGLPRGRCPLGPRLQRVWGHAHLCPPATGRAYADQKSSRRGVAAFQGGRWGARRGARSAGGLQVGRGRAGQWAVLRLASPARPVNGPAALPQNEAPPSLARTLGPGRPRPAAFPGLPLHPRDSHVERLRPGGRPGGRAQRLLPKQDSARTGPAPAQPALCLPVPLRQVTPLNAG